MATKFTNWYESPQSYKQECLYITLMTEMNMFLKQCNILQRYQLIAKFHNMDIFGNVNRVIYIIKYLCRRCNTIPTHVNQGIS